MNVQARRAQGSFLYSNHVISLSSLKVAETSAKSKRKTGRAMETSRKESAVKFRMKLGECRGWKGGISDRTETEGRTGSGDSRRFVFVVINSQLIP